MRCGLSVISRLWPLLFLQALIAPNVAFSCPPRFSGWFSDTQTDPPQIRRHISSILNRSDTHMSVHRIAEFVRSQNDRTPLLTVCKE